jgi:N-acetylmuramoyl-L-alanine amidase
VNCAHGLTLLLVGAALGAGHGLGADPARDDRGSVVPISAPAKSAPAYQPAVRSDGRHVVALDIGHSLDQPGALSASGIPEFEFNRRIVRLVHDRLVNSKRVEPMIINPEGRAITLAERSRRAARAGAALFLAIHHDSVANKYLQVQEINGRKLQYCDRFQGYGVFISRKNPEGSRSLAFARLLGAEMQRRDMEFASHHSEPIIGENRPIIDRERGVYDYDDLVVLKTALMPAALLECGVIVNREQEVLLSQPLFQKLIADAIADAIEQFFTPG